MSSNTVLILAHPSIHASGANATLLSSVQGTEGLEIRSLYSLYPDGAIDVAAEQAALEHADRVILQYPTYWYSTPPLLKQWLDEVLEFGWAYGSRFALEGKTLQVVTTAGATSDDYTPFEQNPKGYGVTMDEILSPLRTTARYLKMQWTQPFVVFNATEATARDMTPSYQSLVANVR